MKRRWWKFALAIAVVGGVFLYNRTRGSGDDTIATAGNPADKNFGAFPPDLPDTMFDDVMFI